ncbi:carbamoyltransferase family protein [Parvicella tangerina]|uniref:Decarbamoylnovobiocin carbamoyltransferase n=1 Tax=Parvicella tangerina TaxID=2829795 RepID=A0A916JJP6_9FLAO|nr:carbamoyltransferase N-terminal domain-containing protein [Parvicella tangerina]CAG5076355.1 Decarbamoylnovobiocin carbamoyltransferase [Parvicella tangerina]
MKYILGISAYFHDSAAALLVDGKTVAAAQEERFTRIKHDSSLPINAVHFCLNEAGITTEDIGAIVFYEKPFQKFERIIDSNIKNIPKGFLAFNKAMRSWFSEKLWIPRNLQKGLNYKGQVYFTEHHESHAASAFYPSPFEESLVIVLDAVGEKSCTSVAIGKDSQIQPLIYQEYPHSLGMFYSAFTYYCGFKVNSGEYKLMGLAPYGTPKYVDLIKAHFISISEEGSIQLTMENYDFDRGLKMLSRKGIALLGKAKRKSESKIDQFYMDIAASVQKVLEEAVAKVIRHATTLHDTKNICLAGGVALNCVANQKLTESFPNHTFWVQPAAGDAGGALGAALAFYHRQNERQNRTDSPVSQVYLGPSYNDQEIENTLIQFDANFKCLDNDEFTTTVAEQLSNHKIVGWFQDKMEFGPRALGNRSILASPVPSDMKSRLNLAIKKREGFRPFAPVVLESEAPKWFEKISTSKYMLQTFDAKAGQKIPACVHNDNTSRVQTVSKQDNQKLHSLLQEFQQKTGVPVLINTSFNLRGEPIVCSPEDAINCFIHTDMDVLVLNNYVLMKEENKHVKPSKDVIRVLD